MSAGKAAEPRARKRPSNKELQAQVESLAAETGRLKEELANVRRESNRRRLPTTRQSVTHKFSISGHEGYLTVGHYEDGQPGEVFIKMAKQGSTVSGLVDTIAILTSLALQYGVPADGLARKFQHTRFEPSGHTNNPELAIASSVSDYVFSWLGLRYSKEFRGQHATRSG